MQQICLLAPGDIRGVHTVVPVRTTIRLLVLQYELEKRRTFVGRSV